MTIYRKTNYRKIYESHYGPIPKDTDGRTYEIHHIDGNKKNNNPDNLVALSIQEHYDVHYSQHDWGACQRIAQRMGTSAEKIGELSSKLQLQRSLNGTHHFLGGKIQRETAERQVREGRHAWQNSNHQRELALQRKALGTLPGQVAAKNGTHNFLGGETQRRMHQRHLENGTHHSQVKWKCPHCNRKGLGKSNYTRYHGDRCKLNG